jgi:hypothetical protein
LRRRPTRLWSALGKRWRVESGKRRSDAAAASPDGSGLDYDLPGSVSATARSIKARAEAGLAR